MALQATISGWLDHGWVQWLLLPGLACVTLAIVAGFGDRRRLRRSNLDAVGFMPWQSIAFWTSLVASVLLGLAAHDWFTAG